MNAARSRAFALLPLLLLAAMVVLGLVIEATRYGTLLWETKVPVTLLLILAFARRKKG